MTRERDDLPESMRAGRFLVEAQLPYLADALWAMFPLEVKPGTLPANVPTAVDPYWRLLFDRAQTESLSAAACASLWLHEMWHLLDECAARQQAAQAFAVLVTAQGDHISAWNVANDMSINARIRALAKDNATAIAAPAHGVFPETFGAPENLTTEDYYERLVKQFSSRASAFGRSGVGSGQCGSGADGVSKPYDEPAPQGVSFSGQSRPSSSPGISPGEGEAIRRKVAENIQRARGTLPAWMELWADQLLAPVVDWRRQLAAYMRGTLQRTAAGFAERTYQRPHRRYAHTNIVVPTWFRPTPRLVIIGDTSGSMANELGRVLAEAEGICRAVGAEVTWMAVDAAVGCVKKIASACDAQLVGGGGTDMGVGIKAACALRPPPHVIVVITDCYTPWPEAAPSVPVIIGNVTAEPPSGFALPAWAHVVDCSATS